MLGVCKWRVACTPTIWARFIHAKKFDQSSLLCYYYNAAFALKTFLCTRAMQLFLTDLLIYLCIFRAIFLNHTSVIKVLWISMAFSDFYQQLRKDAFFFIFWYYLLQLIALMRWDYLRILIIIIVLISNKDTTSALKKKNTVRIYLLYYTNLILNSNGFLTGKNSLMHTITWPTYDKIRRKQFLRIKNSKCFVWECLFFYDCFCG